MRVTALKTFAGKMGLIRGGSTITVDDRYGEQLIRNKLATKADGSKSVDAAPENKNLGNAPENKGEGDVGGNVQGDDETSTSSQDQDAGKAEDSSADRRGGGRGRPLSSQQVARRSRKKT